MGTVDIVGYVICSICSVGKALTVTNDMTRRCNVYLWL